MFALYIFHHSLHWCQKWDIEHIEGKNLLAYREGSTRGGGSAKPTCCRRRARHPEGESGDPEAHRAQDDWSSSTTVDQARAPETATVQLPSFDSVRALYGASQAGIESASQQSISP